MSYQEELWAEDEQKAAESKNQKKSKKQKKKQKMKEKAAEKKKLDVQVTAQPAPRSSGTSKVVASASSKGNEPQAANTSKANEEGDNANEDPTKRNTNSSPSPSRGTIESDSASLGAADDNAGDNVGGGIVLNDSGDTNNRQPPIDLVLYLQQTGSIIALAKLMDSLYDHEFEEEEDEDVDGDGRHQQKTIDLNHRVLTTQ